MNIFGRKMRAVPEIDGKGLSGNVKFKTNGRSRLLLQIGFLTHFVASHFSMLDFEAHNNIHNSFKKAHLAKISTSLRKNFFYDLFDFSLFLEIFLTS